MSTTTTNQVVSELNAIGVEEPTVAHDCSRVIDGDEVTYTKVYAGSFQNDSKAARAHYEEVRATVSVGSVNLHRSCANGNTVHYLVIITLDGSDRDE
ncbi:hypothetical protein KU306_12090 [Haloferax larsenii]|uniref:Uncharacterized protein n=1 Tax=Haloferax larsenii TaxID=302484 RepID=A0ABY5RBV5_HALLR|nr:hypothetical protein [Haloferax larsenii]UVE49644.1 hypothetical protein KU306_12090 [Haloferax larsenii]